MKILSVLLLLLSLQINPSEKIRHLKYNGSTVKTTFEIDNKFLGKYQGHKSGFLQLNSDGSGVYKYDFPRLSTACPGEDIDINWGFIVEDNGEIVRFKRDYGYSYPIIYNCSGENTFQGCTKQTMIDYLLEYDDGTLTISSSDDWEKTDN
jgi:hypothetical protein